MDAIWTNDPFQIKEKIKNTFCGENIFVRLLSAWTLYIAFCMKIHETGNFVNLSFMQDVSLVKLCVLVICIFCILSIPAYLFSMFFVDSWSLLLGSSLCVLQWVLQIGEDSNILFLFSVVFVFLLFVFYIYKKNEKDISRIHLPKWSLYVFLGILFTICFVPMTIIGVLRVKTFSSPNFDYGLFVNMFYNMKTKFLPLITSERDKLLSHFAVHVSPAYYVFLPIYFLFPYAETLQVCQALVLALGVIPVMLLSKKLGYGNKTTVALMSLYALYPAITTSTYYDMHENCFLPLFLLFTFYFYEAKRPVPMYIFATLVLFVKEDAAIYLLLFAIFILIGNKSYKQGAILAIMAIVYFCFTNFMLNKFGTGVMNNRYSNLIYNSDDGLIGAVKTLIVNPGFALSQMFTDKNGDYLKFTYFLQMILPLAFMPFLSKKPSRWLLTAPLLVNLLTNYVYQYDITFQYHFAISAFLIYATMQNAKEIPERARKVLIVFSCVSTLCFYLFFAVPKTTTYTERWKNNKETYLQMEEFLDEELPKDASVACSSFLLAHIADRDEIYEVSYHDNKPDVDYVVLDLRYSSSAKFKSAYMEQGYTVSSQLDGKILILSSPSLK